MRAQRKKVFLIQIRSGSFDVFPYMNQKAMIPYPCEEKRRLFVAYQEATAIYSRTVRELVEIADSVIHAESALLSRRVSIAREAAIEARERFKTHYSEHQC
jgi:hypothetical protein